MVLALFRALLLNDEFVAPIVEIEIILIEHPLSTRHGYLWPNSTIVCDMTRTGPNFNLVLFNSWGTVHISSTDPKTPHICMFQNLQINYF